MRAFAALFIATSAATPLQAARESVNRWCRF